MRTKAFGTTELRVSEIGFGCARLGGILAGSAVKNETAHTLLSALDAGVTFYDTADMYTQGESETQIGKAFRGKRDRVVIASKAGYCLPTQRKLIARVKPLVKPLVRLLGLKRQHLATAVSGSLTQDFSDGYLTNALEASLRRLQTDYLDLYQVHSPPTKLIANGEFIATLERLKGQGKIRYYGVACDTVDDAVLSLKYPGVSAVMFPFGLLDPEAIAILLPLAEKQGVALIGRGCFGGGLLKTSLTQEELKEMTEKWPQIIAYRRLAEQRGRSLLELALQFSHSFAPISVHLLGIRTEAHLRDNLKYLAASPLTTEEMAEIEAIATNVGKRSD
jgi:aryl-alcohol dehydrogenase-like predicted oxidoreductase